MIPFATTLETFGPNAAVWASVLLAVFGLFVLAWQRRRLQGTTLIAPWSWAVICLSALGATETLSGLTITPTPESWIVPLRFVSAMSTFCPSMALFGAKRPQDRAWQFIVLSLWAILSLPSCEWLLFGGMQEIHPARFWFLVVLMSVGAFNSLATRFWAAGLLYCGGQVALLTPFLPATHDWLPGSQGPLLGLVLIVVAWSLRAMGLPGPRLAKHPLDRAWLDFRDSYGVVWGLRIAERINASAASYGWPSTLAWSGFVAKDGQCMTEVSPVVEEGFRNLLRRFVSPAWVDARMGEPAVDGLAKASTA